MTQRYWGRLVSFAEANGDTELKSKIQEYQTLSKKYLTDAAKTVPAKPYQSDVYFSSYSAAVQFARAQAEARGFQVNEDDWFNRVNTGKAKPKPGETNTIDLGLEKDGKEQRKLLHIQVYNRGNEIPNNFELNYYIS